MNEDERRSASFERRLDERLATRIEPFRWGTAYFDLEFPRRYASNFLSVQGSPPDITADGLIAEADRIMGAAGLAHRNVMVDDQALAQLIGIRFAELGWDLDAHRLMVVRREADRMRELPPVEELPFVRVRPLLVEINRREPWATDEEIAAVLADYRGKLEREVGTRFFVAHVDGRPAGVCELYVQGDEAQVESVTTLEEFRGRGVGSAVVLGAVAAAREAGATWIHLHADANDWPRHWYGRLGFEDAGGFTGFLRWPEGHRPEGHARPSEDQA